MFVKSSLCHNLSLTIELTRSVYSPFNLKLKSTVSSRLLRDRNLYVMSFANMAKRKKR